MTGPAQYILRFDDLCPTHARHRWQQWEELIAEFHLKPILAIIPDNRDQRLIFNSCDPQFWARMRALQNTGATIGLHGFRHLCMSRGRSLVSLHRESEFAGVPEAIQRQWIGEGLETLRGHGLNPAIWVAPQHGLDLATLHALRSHGIRLISDGFAPRPFTLGGLVWIPQQLWGPVSKSSGLWTICLHASTMTEPQIEQMRVFLREHVRQFTTVERILKEWRPTKLHLYEKLSAAGSVLRFRARKTAQRLAGRS
jgi:hypothetical protein